MKKRFFKAFCVALSLLTLLCMPVPAVHAEDTTVKWMVSEDLTMLSDGFDTYYLYTVPSEYEWDPLTSVYYYDATTVTVRGSEQKLTATIQTSAPDSGIVALRSSGKTRIYATMDATQALNDYFSSEAHTNCFLFQYYKTGAAVSDDLIKRFYDPTQTQTIDMDVTALKELPCYELVTYDPCLSLCKTFGAIYQLDEEHFAYVDYTLLDNTHFDANGNFSYRNGSVTLSILLADADAGVKAALEEAKSFTLKATYESDPDYEAVGLVIFWIFFVFIGYFLPLIPLLLGLLLPQSAKRGHPKRWYALAILAGLWLLAATVILIILI